MRIFRYKRPHETRTRYCVKRKRATWYFFEEDKGWQEYINASWQASKFPVWTSSCTLEMTLTHGTTGP